MMSCHLVVIHNEMCYKKVSNDLAECIHKQEEMIMKSVRPGFYTAMGTPMNADGSVCEKGLRQHIENQIANGAAGLFIMGTMGCQPAIRTEEYAKVAQIASDAVKGRTALLVGAMDNSIARVRDRIEALHGCELTGVVLTTPFFFPCQGNLLINFFTQIADSSEFPVFLYDQPGVTNNKITNGDLAQLAKHPNIQGIKTADISHVRYLKENHPDFEVLYSHSDLYAAAAALGVDKFLEGMFCATPKNANIIASAFNSGDSKTAVAALQKVLKLRDFFIQAGINPCLTKCLNLLGIEGNCNLDFEPAVSETKAETLAQILREIGELV